MGPFKSSRWIVLGVVVVASASIGCGSSPATGGSGAGGATSSIASTGSGGKNGSGGAGTGGEGGVSGNGGGGATGTGGSGGAGPGNCDDYANAYCSKLASCASDRFIAVWENETICRTQVSAACNASAALPGAGTVDPAACAAALTQSCDTLLDPNPPAACLPGPGDGMKNDACTAQAECGAGLDCFPATKPGCPGFCTEPYAAGDDCNGNSELCDFAHGSLCVHTYGSPNAPTTCEPVAYGVVGDSCKDGTEKQCGSGLVCSASTYKCVTALQVNAACVAIDDECDHRLLLACVLDKHNAHVCTQSIYVTAGAQCGLVNGTYQSCSAFAYCAATSPPTCTLRKMEGEACTGAPDNCYPGFVCMTGTCQTPNPPHCN